MRVAGFLLALLTCALVSILIGFLLSEWIGANTLDSGIASLIGAALGAAITVAGTLWITAQQTNSASKAFLNLLADAVAAVRDEAYFLEKLCANQVQELDQYAKTLVEQVELLKDTLELMERNTQASQIASYDARAKIFKLEKQVKRNLSVFEKELRWLSSPTQRVIANSREDLSEASSNIRSACDEVLKQLGELRDLPSTKETASRMSRVLH